MTTLPFTPEIQSEIVKTIDFAEKHLQETAGAKFTVILQLEKTAETAGDDDKARLIKETIAEYGKYPVYDLEGKSRKRRLTDLRFIAISLIAEHTALTLKKIGLLFQGRDHSCICHAKETVANQCLYNPGFKKMYLECKEIVSRLRFTTAEKITITRKDFETIK